MCGGVRVAVVVRVSVGVLVRVNVRVGVQVSVFTAVRVDDGVRVGVAAAVGVSEGVNDGVGVALGVGVGEGKEVGVYVAVGCCVPPLGSTTRTRALVAWAMYRRAEPSMVSPVAPYNSAKVAGPPSPSIPVMPVPATVVMMPVTMSTRRIRLLSKSEMKRLPCASNATR